MDSDRVAVVVTRLRLLGRLLDALPRSDAAFELHHVLQENALWDGVDPPSTGVTLELDQPLPPDVEAIVMTDAFPAARQPIEAGS